MLGYSAYAASNSLNDLALISLEVQGPASRLKPSKKRNQAARSILSPESAVVVLAGLAGLAGIALPSFYLLQVGKP